MRVPGLDSAAICAQWRDRLPLGAFGYAEEIDDSWRDVGGPTRSMLAQARLAYVFTHAGILGDAACATAGAEAVARMQSLFWRAEDRGWARAIGASGEIADRVIDTYEQAFGLLALAWQYRATGNDAMRALARVATEGLRDAAGDAAELGYPEARGGMVGGSADGGFSRGSPPRRRQNPHMHLLEAFLAWHSADPSGPWLDLAREIVELFRRRFRDPADGTLCEHFDQEWRPAAGDAGRLREPGHHFEWVWLLRRYYEASADDSVFSDAERLYSFAKDRGVDVDGVAFDAVHADGSVVADTKLLWPQTEMLKAHLAWYEWTRDPGARELAHRTLAAIGDFYMIPDSALWRGKLDRARMPVSQPVLSRLLYHLFVALSEAERVLESAASISPAGAV